MNLLGEYCLEANAAAAKLTLSSFLSSGLADTRAIVSRLTLRVRAGASRPKAFLNLISCWEIRTARV